MSPFRKSHFRVGALLAALALGAGVTVAESQDPNVPPSKQKIRKGKLPLTEAELLSAGGLAAHRGAEDKHGPISSPGEAKRGGKDHGRGGNSFVNDPCLDPHWSAPFPENFRRTVQSETEIAVLNVRGSMGKKMVAGYNDSWGFYNNRQGLSGYAYSVNGGNTWVDGGGLPPRVASGAPAGTAGSDAYFGDPVIVVHQPTQTFYYSSLYMNERNQWSLSVNRGRFADAPPPGTPPHVVASESNTRCANDPSEHGIPDPPNKDERIYWELPVEAVPPVVGPIPGDADDDFYDKEWIYVDQNSGTLYLTYTRFEPDGETPIELVRCIGCANLDRPLTSADWTGPTIIVPNEPFEFNQATMPFTTPTGRVIVTWFARQFASAAPFPEIAQRIEYAYSDLDGAPGTFTTELLVAVVDPQGEPPGYNRARPTILNAPYIFVDRGEDDGVFTSQETGQAGFGNVYITYFSGKTPLSNVTKAADIYVSTSTNNGTSFGPKVKVNDDNTNTIHVFPSVQANKHGDVYVAWTDRRQDPQFNEFNDIYAAVSKSFGARFGHNKVQTKVSTSWFQRADAAPNFGDYNSSELLGFNQFVTIWADGRFPTGTFIFDRPPFNPCPPAPAVCDPPPVERRAATPDVIFTISQGLGGGN